MFGIDFAAKRSDKYLTRREDNNKKSKKPKKRKSKKAEKSILADSYSEDGMCSRLHYYIYWQALQTNM